MSHMFNPSVRPEPVEGLSFFIGAGEKEKQGFDKLRANGVWNPVPHHSAASAKVSPLSSSAEQRCMVGDERAIGLVR